MNGLEIGAALTGGAAFITAVAGAWATIKAANRAVSHDAELEARIHRILETRREEKR